MEAPIVDDAPSRTTILGSFLRGRPRNSSIHINTEQQQPREVSPSPPQPPSPNPRRRGPIVPGLMHQQPSNSGSNGGLGFSNMLRRRRSAGNVAAQPAQPPVPIPMANSTTAPPATAANTNNPAGSSSNAVSTPNNNPSHRIRLVPHLDNRRNLRFEAITRELREGDPALRIGRFTDRSGLGLAAVNAMNSNKLAFKSKVVSRAHAEIWAEAGGKFYIKDTKSSSGTFLNHVRLSPANSESKPFQIKDGDILQLGVDYQGGAEDIYKSVKIRIELGREWQTTANAFNTSAVKSLKAIAGPLAQANNLKGGKPAKTQLGDCCICLFPVTIRQSLFITPCSHTFHYKCIRPLLELHHPCFSCPLCRTFADLEEDVEVDMDVDIDDDPAASDEGEAAPAAAEAEAGGGEGEPPAANPDALAAPPRETGAETEVEGDAGPSLLRPRRNNNENQNPSARNTVFGRGSPFTDDPVEEDGVLVEHEASPEPGTSRAMDVDGEMGGVVSMDEVDATVGGKRKR
ncbi:cytoplasmic protein [Coprinopsis cinerea okayama7|uniref:Cytoplasmic protein n=1 Tax=Coprinopsis cinerea (strain Okayama-7 / 130 / ATCC MYA-4618 / FGSC 9003) TaxID=240176 RepID=A8NNS3_COPC7|nr:cytoplasmic protein [Coprinopsis cinerea okayama7\|eukprot:XP_001835189.2 cytoplasmic protein [Coprinopsis cinerea okayama7\